ncbi:MAG: hypothetical protein ABI222_16975 [Opitutaceae bacterium]
MQPPLLPQETLYRVLRLARMDGLGVLMFATFFALTSAAMGDKTGVILWLLLGSAGAVELHGAMLLREFEKRGLNWIVASQFLLLAVVLGQCLLRLTHYDPTLMREALTDEMKTTLAQSNYDQEEFLHTVYLTTYSGIAAVFLLYKLGLALYFQRRRAAVTAATTLED